MADRLRTDELKRGHEITLSYPNKGPSLMKIKSVVKVDEGNPHPIYRITFYNGGFDLMAIATREFDVESSTPKKLIEVPKDFVI